MSKTSVSNGNRLATKIGFVLSSVFLGVTGCTTDVQQPPRRVVYEPLAPPVVYVPPPRVEAAVAVRFPDVEIRAESDFYEPLTQYGRWEVVGTYGRCWIPGRVEANWRPYCNGHWQRTEAGWYWASEEPWGWATYHYGRWDLSPRFGWYWVPQTQWAPAWVSWHEGGGYVGWAPLHPSARISVRGSVEVNTALIAPRAFVFVEPRHFLRPVRPSSVVVNNTTIINKTVNITNIKVVNKTVINEGPRTTIIEQASGRKVQPVAVRELRRKEEAPVIARQRAAPAISDKQVRTSVRSAVELIEKKPQAEPARRVRELEQKIQAEPQRNPGELQKKAQVESEQRQKEAQNAAQEKSQKAAKELARKSQLESERRVREAEQKIQAELPKNAKELEKKTPTELEPRTTQSETKAPAQPQRPGKETKGAVKKGAKGAEDKTQGKKPEQTPQEKPVEPPPPSKN